VSCVRYSPRTLADGRPSSTGSIKQYRNHQPTTKLRPFEQVELSVEVRPSMEWHGASPTISRYVPPAHPYLRSEHTDG